VEGVGRDYRVDKWLRHQMNQDDIAKAWLSEVTEHSFVCGVKWKGE
jgi:hypothetical protein